MIDVQNQLVIANSDMKFQKRGDTTGFGGQLFEIHLTMRYLLQCEMKKANNEIDSFKLRTNIDDVGKFDDVVLEIKYCDSMKNARCKSLFIQAKHKDGKMGRNTKANDDGNQKGKVKETTKKLTSASLLSTSADFGLINYFHGYYQLKNLYNSSEMCCRFDSDWADNDFIIYTNSDFKPDHIDSVIVKKYLADVDISNFGDHKYYYTFEWCYDKNPTKIEIFLDDTSKVVIKCLVDELIRFHNAKEPIVMKEMFYTRKCYNLLLEDVFDPIDDTNQFNEKLPCKFKRSFVEENGIETIETTNKRLALKQFRDVLFANLKRKDLFKEEKDKTKLNESIKGFIFLIPKCNACRFNQFEEWPNATSMAGELKAYLQHVKIYSDKANNEALVKEMKNQLQNYFNIKGQQKLALCFSYVYMEIKNWWKESTIEPIDETRKIFEGANNLVAKNQLVVMSRLFVDKIIDNNINFLSVKNLKSIIESSQIIHVYNDKNYINLSLVRVYQAIKEINIDRIDHCFVNDLKSVLLVDETISVVDHLADEGFDFIVLKCQRIELNQHIKKFSKSLFTLINGQSNEKIKIIFISEIDASDNVVPVVQHFAEIFQNFVGKKEGSYKLTDFDDQSQENFLTRTIVNFQGNDVTFIQLLGRTKSLRQYVNGHLLTNSFVHRKIYLNNKMVGKLNSNISTGKLKKLNEKNEEVDDGKEVKTLEDIIDRIVIISDVCGAGKTTFLDSIIQNTMDANHLHWIVKIDLNDCSFPQSETLRFPEENRNNATIDFLLDSLQLETNLEEEMLRHRIENEGNVSVLFDGFDRICPRYKYIAIDLFQNLKNTKIDRLWIVSRPQMVEELHEKLQPSTVYALERLSKDEQRELIFKIWNEKNNDQSINIDKQKYFEKLDKFLEAFLNDSELKFTGIPLYTKILAKFYEQRFLKWKSDQSNFDLLPNDLDLIDLYQHLIDETFQFYFKKQNIRDVQTKDNEIVQQQSLHDHQLLALDAQFFNKSLLRDIHSNDHSGSTLITELKENKSNVKVGQQQVGLVVKIITTSAESKPLFIHATIADYLAAFWFVNNYKKYDWSKNILRNTQFDATHVNFRKFYDLLLVKNYNGNIGVQNEFSGQQTVENYLQAIEKASQDKNLHELKRLVLSHNNSELNEFSILRRQIEDRNWDELKRNATLNESKENVDEAIKNKNLDRLREIGRTFIEYKLLEYRLLQTAVEERNLDRVKHLIRQGVDVNAAETTKWTALTKAVERRAYYIVDHLVKRVRDITAADGFSWTPLHRAIDRQDLGLVKLLLDNGADVNVKNGQGTQWTAVERAINIGSVPITKFLIDNGAKVKTDRARCPLLLRAIQKGNYELVKILIDAGAEVDIKTPSGHKLFFYAQQTGDERIIKLIKQKMKKCVFKF